MNRTAMVLATASLLVGGCQWFENPSPNEARLVIQGETGRTVRLIVSTKFVASVNEIGQTRVVIFEADTVVTSLPYEHVYTIGRDERFFAEAARLDADLQNVRMQIYLDRRKEFDEGGPLLEGQAYRFVYTFNQLVTRDVVVI